MTRLLALMMLVLITTTGCNKNNQQSNNTVSNNMKETENLAGSKRSPKRIGDYMSYTTDYFWCPRQSETSSYWIRIVFRKEFAVYQFNRQCIYWFFTNHYYTKADKIELLWSFKNDCLLSMDFLEKSNGIKNYPKTGDAFCEYSLLNDTVIVVKYNFPEWTEKINEMEKDSIFPKYLYLKKKGVNRIFVTKEPHPLHATTSFNNESEGSGE